LLDLRVGRCYFDDSCENPNLGSFMTKQTCCCTVGQSWGDDCEVCPAANSQEKSDLCAGNFISKWLFR